MSKIDGQLATVQKEREAEMKALEERYRQKTIELLSAAKQNFSDALKTALDCLNAVPQDYLDVVLKDAEIKKMLRALSIVPEAPEKSRARRTRRPSPKVSDEVILKFLETERSVGDVLRKFKFSPVTVGNRLARLLEAGKATVRRDETKKTRKLWKKA
jgi:DNA-binding transcriptional ArsR family regulator